MLMGVRNFTYFKNVESRKFEIWHLWSLSSSWCLLSNFVLVLFRESIFQKRGKLIWVGWCRFPSVSPWKLCEWHEINNPFFCTSFPVNLPSFILQPMWFERLLSKAFRYLNIPQGLRCSGVQQSVDFRFLSTFWTPF